MDTGCDSCLETENPLVSCVINFLGNMEYYQIVIYNTIQGDTWKSDMTINKGTTCEASPPSRRMVILQMDVSSIPILTKFET